MSFQLFYLVKSLFLNYASFGSDIIICNSKTPYSIGRNIAIIYFPIICGIELKIDSILERFKC